MSSDAADTRSSTASIPPPESASPPPSFLRKIFASPDGIRPGWRCAIFYSFFVAFMLLVLGVLSHFTNFGQLYKRARAGTITPGFEVTFEVVQFGAALLAAAIMSRIEKRRIGSYGIPLRGAFGKNFWTGILWGLGFYSVELLLIHALGGFSYGTFALSGAAVLRYAAIWALGFLLVGLAEEYVFRGYAQFTLTTAIGFWPAAFLLSAAFGAAHLFNAGEGWVGALSVMTFGLFACFTLRRTGNLWFAIGFHAAGDYAESFIYSVPDSGNLVPGHLLHSTFHGSKWLTGGSIGPEGSLLAFVVFALAFLLFAWLYPAKERKEADADQSPAGIPA